MSIGGPHEVLPPHGVRSMVRDAQPDVSADPRGRTPENDKTCRGQTLNHTRNRRGFWMRTRSRVNDRDDESAGIRRLVDGRVGCEVGARTRSDPSSDWRFGCLSCDLSAEPEHRLARTGRANVTS